jgi:hypothetical protein
MVEPLKQAAGFLKAISDNPIARKVLSQIGPAIAGAVATGAYVPGLIPGPGAVAGAGVNAAAAAAPSVWGSVKKWWGNNAPTWAGGNPAGAGTVGTGAPGKYRPAYSLGNADLSDSVINTIAGEAIAGNQTSTDAVINNMLNRVGTKGYGPSGNLEQVARAPGQYAGYRDASPQEAAFIRARIQAIASGGVPDSTSGSNEYRASTYNGPWTWSHSGAPVIGGNRFAYNAKVAPGPYAPYSSTASAPSGLPFFAGAPADPWAAFGISSAQAADISKRHIGADAFKSSPYGALPPGSTFDNSQDNPTLHQKTSIHLYGVGEGNEELGSKIARHQYGVNAGLIRNLAGNVG